MDNKRIDMYERRFKDHVATFKQLDEETQVLTFKRPDSIMWSTEFIFRKFDFCQWRYWLCSIFYNMGTDMEL